MAKKEHTTYYLSYYKLSMWKRCPCIMDWWEKVPRDERPERDARNAVVGSVIHALAEDYLKGEIGLLDMYAKYPEYLKEFEGENYIKWRGRNDRAYVSGNISRNVANVESLFKTYSITPENSYAEVPMRLVRETDEFTIAGRIDIITRRPDGSSEIFDLKATDRGRTYVYPEQMRAYFLLMLPYDLPCRKGTFLLTHDGAAWTIDRNPSAEHDLYLEMLSVATRLKEEAGQLPMVPGKHCEWCEFKSLCPGFERRNDPPEEIETILVSPR